MVSAMSSANRRSRSTSSRNSGSRFASTQPATPVLSGILTPTSDSVSPSDSDPSPDIAANTSERLSGSCTRIEQACALKVRRARSTMACSLTRSRFSDTALPPFLGEAPGGGTTLVYVAIVRDQLYHAVRPDEHGCGSHLKLTAAVGRAGVLRHYGEDNSVAVVEDLLDHDLVFVEASDPPFKEAAYRGSATVGAQTPRMYVPDRILTAEADHRVDVSTAG